ncbi:MAG: DUF962 domain-containing protein [Bdellovibrionaceae bacterium]|nr:DUF962 domain-containing protein [Pseudobdellovibrionaceae bacterium]
MATRTLQNWLDEYGVSHRNRRNVLIHKVCVPAIFWSLLGFFFGLPYVVAHAVGYTIILAGLVFYARLGAKAFGLMLIVVSLCLFSYQLLIANEAPLWQISLGVFVVAWIGQFIGHKIEGRKPSFFQDLQFLLIGPLWVFFGRRV